MKPAAQKPPPQTDAPETLRASSRSLPMALLRALEASTTPLRFIEIGRQPMSEGHYQEIAAAIGNAEIEQLYVLLDRAQDRLTPSEARAPRNLPPEGATTSSASSNTRIDR